MSRRLLRILLVLAVLGLPLSCVTAWTALHVGSPFIMNFWYGFSVRNDAGETIYITPIGAVGSEGYRERLPLSHSKHFAIPPAKDSDFRLSPGETRRLIYNWDDINFSELAIRDEAGHWSQLVINPNPTEIQYQRVAQNFFVVPTLSELPAATEAVRKAAVRPGKRTSLPWLLSIAGIFPALLFMYCLWRLSLMPRGASPREA